MSEKDQREETPKNENDPILDESLSKTESIILNNKKKITNILAGVVLIIALFVFLKKQVWEPKEIEAKNYIYEGQQIFEQDSFQLALTYFEDLAENYGGTDAGNGAKLYKGISEIKLGYYEEAISSLKDFSASGYIFPGIKNGLLGDSYSELGEWETAVDYYRKAAKKSNSEVLSPYYFKKAALLLEQNQDFATAAELYEEILNKYYFEGNNKYGQQRNEIVKLYHRAKVNI